MFHAAHSNVHLRCKARSRRPCWPVCLLWPGARLQLALRMGVDAAQRPLLGHLSDCKGVRRQA